MSNPQTIWCNQELTPTAMARLEAGLSGHKLIFPAELKDNLGRPKVSGGGQNSSLASADIALGQPDPELVMQHPNLRWIQITSAGYTRYDRPDLRAALAEFDTPFTNSSSVYADPCAQHLLAFMLTETRQLLPAWVDQRTQRLWRHGLRPRMRLLRDAKVLIVGYGAIGERLAALLDPFGAEVTGFRRTVRGDERVPTHTYDHLESELAAADHVVNILPAHETTQRFFGPALFDQFKPGAVFYNMGRGTTVDQPALIAALASGQLAAAYLDVTDPEPLPADHPLWEANNCFITPHTGGGFAAEHTHLVEHFLANFGRFLAGEPLRDRVF